jgi:hypothetical protein
MKASGSSTATSARRRTNAGCGCSTSIPLSRIGQASAPPLPHSPPQHPDSRPG